MAQSQEHAVDTRADGIEPKTMVHRPRELSYAMAQVIAVLITSGVLVVLTVIFALLTG